MKPTVLHYPVLATSLCYKGRNGTGTCTGLHLQAQDTYLVLRPLTSRKVLSSACELEIPKDKATLATLLSLLQAEHDKL
jgi:hypothetical protein